jgi:hypothetical protein
MFAISKAADLNQLVHGGQLYRAFPFSKGSLAVSNTAVYITTSKSFYTVGLRLYNPKNT